MGASNSSPKADPAEILRAAKIIHIPGMTVELRILGARRNGIVSGYFDEFEPLVESAAYWSSNCEGVYWTINPVNPVLQARADNRVRVYAKDLTKDTDILARRWIVLDFDPKRPAGTSASDEEHELAIERARAICFQLSAEGWPPPLLADSGNGAHALFRIDLPNDEASTILIQRMLQGLAQRFDDERIKIDPTVFNASRVIKVYGTLACKGDNFNGRSDLAPRPHRLARGLW